MKAQLFQASAATRPAAEASTVKIVVATVLGADDDVLHLLLRDGKPLLSAFAAMVLSNFLLVISPKQSFFMIILSTVLTAYGTAVSFPFIESLLAILLITMKELRLCLFFTLFSMA